MRITVPKTALADALTWVARSLPARPAQPILAGIRITVANQQARFSAYDYENAASVAIPVAVEEDGEVLISGRLLSDIVKSLPAGDVTLGTDGAKVLVKRGSSKFTVPTMPMDDYPALPALPNQIGVVDGREFTDAARRVSIAAGKDDALPILAAVHVVFDIAAATITMTATDRYRLAKKTIPFQPAPGAADAVVLIPARALDGYAKTLAGEAQVSLLAGADDNTFAIIAGERAASTRLFDGEYPKVDSIFPTGFAVEAVVDTSDLLDAVKRVGLVADRNTPCRLNFTGDNLTVSAGRVEEQSGSEDVAVADLAGDPIEIAINFAYLTDGLSTAGEDQVRFLMVAPNKPLVIRPASDTTGRSSYLSMPLRATGQ